MHSASRTPRAVLHNACPISFSTAVARRCASLREQLRTAGKRVRPRALDLLIAATALDHNLTLVTRNVKDYDDIPDLRLYQRT
jgi:tRNA(fMet)-specific endonuclease VapC